VVPAKETDLPAWLRLASEVEHLFGPMADDPDFCRALREAIAEQRAFCVRDTAGGRNAEAGSASPLIGGVLISRKSNAVAWLAVSEADRGQGMGRALLARALNELDAAKPVTVQTFAPDVPQGAAARRLYARFGFRDREAAEPTPAGVPTVLMVREPRRERASPAGVCASGDLPCWAPRVPQLKIRRLYETDAKGWYDEELIDEVGYGLLTRCESFIAAVGAVRGRATCPRCGDKVPHNCRKEELLRCQCGWELTWGDYFRTIQHKQLSGAEPVLDLFRQFVESFPRASTPQQKMVEIDRVLHGFHWYAKNTPTRPVAVNLIEGRLRDVIALLDELTYGKDSTPGLAETKATWDKRIENAKSWGARSNATP
jgi:ribosomal protein S18 acetylase RimI-like enzyme